MLLSKKKWQTVHHAREEFLCNTRNIARLIKLLSQYLKEDGHTVVETALDFALEKNSITAFVEDRHIYTTFKVIFLEEKFSWKPTKIRIKFKSSWVSERLQRDWILSSLRIYCLYMFRMVTIQGPKYWTRVKQHWWNWSPKGNAKCLRSAPPLKKLMLLQR